MYLVLQFLSNKMQYISSLNVTTINKASEVGFSLRGRLSKGNLIITYNICMKLK